MSEVEKFDRMEHRDRCAAFDLSDAADVSGSDEIGRNLHDVRNLALAQPRREQSGLMDRPPKGLDEVAVGIGLLKNGGRSA
jgi:hypothetical protein